MNLLTKFILYALGAFVALTVLFHGISYVLYFVGISSEFLGLNDFVRNYYIIGVASFGLALRESFFKSSGKSRD